jgi:hypothetical protein
MKRTSHRLEFTESGHRFLTGKGNLITVNALLVYTLRKLQFTSVISSEVVVSSRLK